MTVYLDASVLVPAFVADAGSAKVVEFLTSTPDERLVSEFAVAEVGSSLSRLVRMSDLTAGQAHEALAEFDNWRLATATTIDVQPVDVRHAGSIVRRFELGIRAPDALHLAVCNRLGATLVTMDRRLAQAARVSGVETEFLEASNPALAGQAGGGLTEDGGNRKRPL